MPKKKKKTISKLIDIIIAIVFCWGLFVLGLMLATPY